MLALAVVLAAVQKTVILADEAIRLKDGSKARLVLVMPSATISESRDAPSCEDPATGKVVAKVSVQGKPTVTTDITGAFRASQVEFCGYPFPLVFADYNHDGQLDFNLSAGETSNGSCYVLLTVNADRTVTSLPLPGRGWACCADFENSTSFFELTSDGFRTYGHDPALGMFHMRWRWDPKSGSFVLAEEHDEYPRSP